MQSQLSVSESMSEERPSLPPRMQIPVGEDEGVGSPKVVKAEEGLRDPGDEHNVVLYSCLSDESKVLLFESKVLDVDAEFLILVGAPLEEGECLLQGEKGAARCIPERI